MSSKFLLSGFLFFIFLLLLPEIALYVLPNDFFQSGILFTIFLIVLSFWLRNEENNKLTKRKESRLVKNSIFETVKFDKGYLFLNSSQLFQCLYTFRLETNIGSFSVYSKPPPSFIWFPSIGTYDDEKFYSSQQELGSLELNGEFRFEFSVHEASSVGRGLPTFRPIPRILILRRENP